MKKRIVFTLLAALLVLCALFSCGKQPDFKESVTVTLTTAGSTTAAETTVAPSQDLVLVDAEGNCAFSIVRGDLCDTITRDIAMHLHTNFNRVYGVNKIKLVSDWVKKSELDEAGQYVSDGYELLIGETNRVETELAKAMIKDGNDYVITTVGDKLVIVGKNSLATKAAVQLFISDYVLKGEKPFAMKRDAPILGKGEANAVDLAEGAEFRIMTFNVAGTNGEPTKRYPLIQEMIDVYQPDIVGFQEFNKAQHNNTLAPMLRNGYAVNCQYHGNGTYNYTPIAYRKDKFEQLEGGVEWLDSRYTGTNTKSISWTVLKDKATGKTFGVINMHGAVLNNGYTGYETMSSAEMNKIVNEWRIDNVRQMLEIETRLKAAHGDIAFFFTGDFNFNSSSDAYNATKKAGLTEAEVSSTGSKVTGQKTSFGFGTVPGAGLSIDHVFYRLEKATTLLHYIPRTENFELQASDHLAVFADVAVK